MAGIGRHGLVVIRSSHEDLSDPTSHLLMPTAEQGPFPPFDRFAETVATRRIQLGLHPHLAEEVVTYVIDGLVHHEDGSGNHTVLNRSEEHTSELQSPCNLVCRLLLETKEDTR